ncbi:MAG TPA: YwqG family protein [Myxococcaceae bacterium]|nr:YwqG family protein [Myxococcaceae bacterium]
MKLEEWVEEFAFHVAAQTDAMERGMPGTGNRHAQRYAVAFETLLAHGSEGMNALSRLLTYSRLDVRTMAASLLLEHGHHEPQARAVLEQAAQGQGLIAWGASESLKRWKERSAAPISEPGVDATPPPLRRRKPAQPHPSPFKPLDLPASLEPHRTLLEGALAPCILFDKEEAGMHSRGCRYGGLPLVPAGTHWPRSPEGSLHFLGQLDFAELTACRGEALPELPREGLLAFFYDVENQPWGRQPGDRAFWKLVYVPPGVEPVPLQPPDDLREAARPILTPSRLIPSLGRCLPGWWDQRAPVEPGFWNDEQAEDLGELQRRLVGGESVDWAVDQVRGHPAWIQDDARLEVHLVSQGLDLDDTQREPAEMEQLKRAAASWNLLWQVAFDEQQGFEWGSSGTVYLLIRDEDLRACRFERAWLVLQCT